MTKHVSISVSKLLNFDILGGNPLPITENAKPTQEICSLFSWFVFVFRLHLLLLLYTYSSLQDPTQLFSDLSYILFSFFFFFETEKVSDWAFTATVMISNKLIRAFSKNPISIQLEPKTNHWVWSTHESSSRASVLCLHQLFGELGLQSQDLPISTPIGFR